MRIKVSDYIVDFFVQKGITDVFGYPGGMVTHLMESFRAREDDIKAHVNYHEQAAAFSACGYAQICNKAGVAYATSGPGATNLITGICNAYFDSIPTMFITGQVNTFESKGGLKVRQKGFQETDIVALVRPVTKYASYLENPDNIRKELEKAWYIANEGRKGPVVLDIPMNVLRSEVEIGEIAGYEPKSGQSENTLTEETLKILKNAKRPVLLVGAGAKGESARRLVKDFVEKYEIPTVTSMLAFDVLEHDNRFHYGFIGAYGKRTANFIVAKCDTLIAIGSRMDVRQVGAKKENFAPNAVLVRVDIDDGELSSKMKENELQIKCHAEVFLQELLNCGIEVKRDSAWIKVCDEIKCQLGEADDREPNLLIRRISQKIMKNAVITTDVGQNQVWIAQSFDVKEGQKVLFSGGHGAMGYSLPAAIGAHYAKKQKVISFNGDGGIQMNIQELQFVARERLPITIVILNNHALGMIRHFQEMYFSESYYQTVQEAGYSVPDFGRLAAAYDLAYTRIEEEQAVDCVNWNADFPQIVEVILSDKTYVFPKLEFGKPNQDQEPLIDRELYKKLMKL